MVTTTTPTLRKRSPTRDRSPPFAAAASFRQLAAYFAPDRNVTVQYRRSSLARTWPPWRTHRPRELTCEVERDRLGKLHWKRRVAAIPDLLRNLTLFRSDDVGARVAAWRCTTTIWNPSPFPPFIFSRVSVFWPFDCFEQSNGCVLAAYQQQCNWIAFSLPEN